MVTPGTGPKCVAAWISAVPCRVGKIAVLEEGAGLKVEGYGLCLGHGVADTGKEKAAARKVVKAALSANSAASGRHQGDAFQGHRGGPASARGAKQAVITCRVGWLCVCPFG